MTTKIIQSLRAQAITATQNQRLSRPGRRQFLIGTAAVGAGLALGLTSSRSALAQATAQALSPEEVNLWVVIKPDDTVVIR
ncbi:MAG: hypothetical protein WCJ34_08800, partial [Alcaligenaceae bacterium]